MDSYVPGATAVFVVGIPSSINKMNGTANIGQLTIDFTSSLASSKSPTVSLWAFSGIQPRNKGLFLSSSTAKK
jgi:hypothetical protein